MPRSRVSIQVFKEYATLVSPKWLRRVVRTALDVESWEGPSQVELAIVDDETVRELNRQYRGVDENTDVLAFSNIHQGEYYGSERPSASRKEAQPFVSPPGEDVGLGEVIVSYPQAQRQAQEADHSTEQELAHLVVHGVLHLMGYDHMEPEEEAAMKEKEGRLLAAVLERI